MIRLDALGRIIFSPHFCRPQTIPRRVPHRSQSGMGDTLLPSLLFLRCGYRWRLHPGHYQSRGHLHRWCSSTSRWIRLGRVRRMTGAHTSRRVRSWTLASSSDLPPPLPLLNFHIWWQTTRTAIITLHKLTFALAGWRVSPGLWAYHGCVD